MANFSELIEQIRQTVYENTEGEVTATKVQELLINMVEDIDDVKMDKIDGITTISFDSATDTLTINGVDYQLTPSGPTPPEPPTPIIVYDKPTLNCQPTGIVSGDGATLQESDFIISYSQNWTEDGVPQTPITTGGTVKFSHTQNGTYNSSITIEPNNTGSLKSVVIYAKVTMNGQTSDAVTVTLTQAVRVVNRVKYAEVPITQQQRNEILTTPASVMNYLNDSLIKSDIESYIQTNNTTISDYKLADTSIQTHDDEYELNTTTNGNFIQVFLITNQQHNVVGYDDIAGSPQSYYQVPIEDLTMYNSFKWTEQSYTLGGTQYKLIALLNNSIDTISFKIQMISL